MKIIFICGSLEPGRDGVGDYTRRLSEELIRQGQSITIIAFNDHHALESIETIQNVNGISINILRLSGRESSKNRFNKSFEFIDQFDPEWLSLQYVPFSFHQKGLPWRLAKQLKLLGNGRKWHVMFHELWVGMELGANYKMILWGRLQKAIIRLFYFQLNPSLVHTQTRLHQFQLNDLGINAEILPLFSNISVIKSINANNINKSSVGEKTQLSLVAFGTIQSGAPFLQFAKEASNYEKCNNVKITLTLLGRPHPEQEKWSSIWINEGLTVKNLGELPAEGVSEILLNATFGIASTAFINIEKSGSVAAMLNHGLPVICISKPWEVKNLAGFKPQYKDVSEYKPGNLHNCLNAGFHQTGNDFSLQKISEKFIETLKLRRP